MNSCRWKPAVVGFAINTNSLIISSSAKTEKCKVWTWSYLIYIQDKQTSLLVPQPERCRPGERLHSTDPHRAAAPLSSHTPEIEKHSKFNKKVKNPCCFTYVYSFYSCLVIFININDAAMTGYANHLTKTISLWPNSQVAWSIGG